MTPTPRLPRPSRRLAPGVALLVAAAALGLGGCAGTGMDAQTNAQYQPGVGANVRSGSIDLYNALAVDNGDGTATFSAAILNRDTTPAKLLSASAHPRTGPSTNWGTAAEPLIVGAGNLVNIGKSGTVIMSGKDLEAGDYVDVTLTFDRGREVSVEAPVVARTAIYDDVATNAGGDSAAAGGANATVPAGAPEPAAPATH